MGVKFWSSKTLELWKRKQSSHFGLDKKRLPWRPFLKNNLAVSSVGPSKLVTEDPQHGVSEPVLKGVPTPRSTNIDGARINPAASEMAFGVAKELQPP